jgi:hypothetical protein
VGDNNISSNNHVIVDMYYSVQVINKTGLKTIIAISFLKTHANIDMPFISFIEV